MGDSQANACKPHPVNCRVDMMNLYFDHFNELGKFPGEAYDINVDPSYLTKKTPVRSVPIH